MFASFKNRVISVLAPDLPSLPPVERELGGYNAKSGLRERKPDKFQYARPPFLQLLTPDELNASADHNVRPIIVPRDITLLPWQTGYAECVNSGKSEWNEDQGAFCRQVLSDPEHRYPQMPYTYFGVFDGHAGYGAALAASNQFHYILHEKLVDCIDLLLPREEDVQSQMNKQNQIPHPLHFQRKVNKDEIIIGALESAFFHMDSMIAQDRDRYRDAGGCTACVSLFINGKMFIANAGDSRAVLCQRNTNGSVAAVPLSFDHTPETERERLLNIARLKPHLLGRFYVAMEYARRPQTKDLGQRILCRHGTMQGWTYKTLTPEDLLMPVVTGEGKRSRLLGTLGVTRGFGDHDLLAIYSGLQIKPFLTPQPDVNIKDLSKIVSIPDENNEDGDYGILVMATDGLWDVSENDTVSELVFQTLKQFPNEKRRYTMVAQELVARARGKINEAGHWRLSQSRAPATVDDITVIVIPVHHYFKEHLEWEKKAIKEFEERLANMTHVATEAQETQSLMNGPTDLNNTNLPSISNIIEPQNTINHDDDDDDEIVAELDSKLVKAHVEEETIEYPSTTAAARSETSNILKNAFSIAEESEAEDKSKESSSESSETSASPTESENKDPNKKKKSQKKNKTQSNNLKEKS